VRAKLTFIAVGALSLLAANAPSTPTPTAKMVTVTIHRIKEINNMDTDLPRKDQADFYARVWIGTKSKKTTVLSKDDGYPNWRVSSSVSGNMVSIKIRVMDDDGGLEEKDDHVDVCPVIGKKDLELQYNVRTGRISGDVSGRKGQRIHTRGGGEDDHKAEIWFSVR
jgi:hypothetical protein